jgi:hypothetical protein
MTAQPFTPSRSADFLVSVEGLGIFANLDAIEVSGQSTPIYDGGALDPYILGNRAAPAEFGLTRPFSYAREMDIYQTYLPQVNARYLNVMIYPTDAQMQSLGRYFQGRALLTALSLPAVDSNRDGAPTVPVLAVKLRAPKWSVV